MRGAAHPVQSEGCYGSTRRVHPRKRMAGQFRHRAARRNRMCALGHVTGLRVLMLWRRNRRRRRRRRVVEPIAISGEPAGAIEDGDERRLLDAQGVREKIRDLCRDV